MKQVSSIKAYRECQVHHSLKTKVNIALCNVTSRETLSNVNNFPARYSRRNNENSIDIWYQPRRHYGNQTLTSWPKTNEIQRQLCILRWKMSASHGTATATDGGSVALVQQQTPSSQYSSLIAPYVKITNQSTLIIRKRSLLSERKSKNSTALLKNPDAKKVCVQVNSIDFNS